MAKETLQQKLVEYHKMNGWEIVKGKSSKYIVMKCSGVEDFIYIGKSGALRQGRTISESFSIPDHLKKVMIEKVDKSK